ALPILVHGAEWRDEELVLRGHYAAGSPMQLVFKARGRDEEHRVALERDGAEFTASFAPSAIATLSGTLPLPAGSYQLWGRVEPTDGGTRDVGAELDPGFVRSLPLRMETAEREYSFGDSGFDTPVLRVGSDLRPEIGRAACRDESRDACTR